jgi:hypothetical protein
MKEQHHDHARRLQPTILLQPVPESRIPGLLFHDGASAHPRYSNALFGLVFSSGLAGMTLGSLFLAPIADHSGRRILILIARQPPKALGSSLKYGQLNGWNSNLPQLPFRQPPVDLAGNDQ